MTLIYKAPSTVTKQETAIFIGTLIQKTNRFERAPLSEEVVELILVYTIIPKEDDLKKLEETPKFTKVNMWPSAMTPELSKPLITSKTPDSETSPWNTLNIPENTPGINAIGLEDEEENPWKSSNTGRLISPPGTPVPTSQILKVENIEDLLKTPLDNEKPLRDLYIGTSNLRFGPDRKENPFILKPINWIPVLPTFPMWESTEDVYYYNLLKDKRPVKRKVTFEQIITTPPSNLLSGKQLKY